MMPSPSLSTVIIDDGEVNLLLFKALVSRIPGLEPRCFSVSAEGLRFCEESGADIVIVDYMMPAPDGIEFIRRFRKIPGMLDVPVVMITANPDKAVRHEALQAGATDFLTKPIDKTEFTARITNMAALRASQRLLADRAAWLDEEVRKKTATIVEQMARIAARELDTIVRLTMAAEYRDPETGGHIKRMAHYSKLIAAGLGLPDDEQQQILDSAPMHDIGKVGTPDRILLKPGRLDDEEMKIMKDHAGIGHKILEGSESPILKRAAVIALSHHEKFDGSGYPQGLAGEDIPLHGRIVALADVFDALTSARPYKKAWDLDRATAFIREQSGSHFDPACVDAFFANWDGVLAIRALYGDPDEETTPGA